MTQNKTKERFVSLKNDYAFTQIMRNEMVLKGFLSAVLKIPVGEITKMRILDRHLEKLSEDDKLGILDVRVSIRDEEDIDIELQIRGFHYWVSRTIFYICKMYTEHVRKGEWYDNCKKVIHISILDFNLFPTQTYFYESFHLRGDKTKDKYSDLIELHIIELKKLDNCIVSQEDKDLEKWCRLICAKNEEELMMVKTDSYIKAAIDELNQIKTNEEKYNEYEWRERALRDYISQMLSERELGKSEGKEEGKEEGKAEGKIIGGREEQQRYSSLILRLLNEGKSDMIAIAATNADILQELYKSYGI